MIEVEKIKDKRDFLESVQDLRVNKFIIEQWGKNKKYE